MYEVIKQINDTTALAVKENIVYILKKIHISDAPLYKALMTIDNPNVAKIYEFVTIEDDFFVVEEYIQGVTVKQFVEKNPPIDNDTVVSIALGICNGLQDIHALGIIHRDITPTNIMIDTSGTPKIIDFGISRFEKNHQASDTQILGTHGFAAPEQYGFSQTSVKSDIYSLGVLINYIATKFLPNEVPATGFLGKIVKKCTEVDENKRYSTVIQLKSALKKRGVAYFVHAIPGFRKGKTSHILIALTYYFFVAVGIVSMIATAINALDAFCLTMVILLTMICPVGILLDYCDWTKKLNITRNMTDGERIAVKVAALFLCIFLSMFFILLSPTQ